MLSRGHRVRVLGGMPLAAAFETGGASLDIDLLPAGTEEPAAFLRSLDCFVYRKHPAWYETGGVVILEAMAAGLPVVVFDEDCGGVDWIRPGVTGFVVKSDHEALEIVDRLAEQPDLRRAIGDAARREALALMAQARRDTPRFYFQNAFDEHHDASSAVSASGPAVSHFVATPLRRVHRAS
jgi:glycosyltransferase involved in cell wall biosynthesis